MLRVYDIETHPSLSAEEYASGPGQRMIRLVIMVDDSAARL